MSCAQLSPKLNITDSKLQSVPFMPRCGISHWIRSCKNKACSVLCASCVSSNRCKKHGFLGRGQYASVYVGELCESTNIHMPYSPDSVVVSEVSTMPKLQVALKVIQHKSKLGENLKGYIDSEIDIMTVVTREIAPKCPNLLPLLDVVDHGNSAGCTTLVMPLLKEDLMDTCIRKVFTEKEARPIVFQLLNALSYLHAWDIWHLDVKLENIAFYSDLEPSQVMLFDYGLSVRNKGDAWFYPAGPRGTLCYLSPEILQHHCYSSAADIWAVGCVVYILITQQYPFAKPANSKDGSFERKNLENCSKEVLDLLESIFVVDATHRPTAEDLMAHAWFTEETTQ